MDPIAPTFTCSGCDKPYFSLIAAEDCAYQDDIEDEDARGSRRLRIHRSTN